MEHQAAWALAIFLIVYAFVISGTIHRTVVAMAGALLAVILGIADQDAVIRQGFGMLGFLIGMMIIINITAETGVFRFIAVWAARKVNADPVRFLVLLTFATAVCSAFLNNMLTVLLMVPVILSITRLLQVNPLPYLIAQIAASGAGGMATLAGSTPNIMIGHAVKELDFASFFFRMAPISAMILLMYVLVIILLFGKHLKTTAELKNSLMEMDPSALIADRKLLTKCLAVVGLTVLGFFLHDLLHLELAVVALSGAFLLLLLTGERAVAYALSRTEWTTIFYMGGIFAVVSALAETGVMARFAEAAMNWTGGHIASAAMLILWISAIASAFADNIPLVAAMIPLILEMGKLGAVDVAPLWWSLILGSGLGGSGTLIGAGVGLAMARMAAKEGHAVGFVVYLKTAFPLMILSVALSSVYIYIRYLL